MSGIAERRPPHPLEAAWADAEAAARFSRVELRTVEDIGELTEVQRLYERIWRIGDAAPPVTADMLRAIAKAGGYVSGAFERGALVGACFGFFGPPVRRTLHSHIAGVDPRALGRSVGFALKLHQRAWALQHGAEAITWTYDPLIRRNAHFNLGKLAATAVEYLPGFYGPMDDDINRADDTDRVLVRWRLTDGLVSEACAGRPPRVSITAVPGARVALGISASGGPAPASASGSPPRPGDALLVAVPADVEALRLRDPALAADWRIAVRDTLGAVMAEGARVTGFDRAGWYIVEQTERQEQP